MNQESLIILHISRDFFLVGLSEGPKDLTCTDLEDANQNVFAHLDAA